ncbi:MAG: hypothetical protein ABIT70_13760 [Sulfuriferula sp.]
MMSEPLAVVPVSYCLEWVDGFGARGWKLDVALDDPEVIAATSETGRLIPTSVLVHDILDHHLCGLPPSGHRYEAIALHQLELRTGADPRADLLQMIDEDLMHGGVVGETMLTFLPNDLRALLPPELRDNRAIANHLIVALGQENLRQALVRHMVEIGRTGAEMARTTYQRTGLDHAGRGPLGLALQSLLAQIDTMAVSVNWENAHGVFTLTKERCALHMDIPQPMHIETTYH